MFPKHLFSALVIIVLLFSSVFSAAAQEADELPAQQTVQLTRVLGDQYLNIALGINIPLFIHNPDPAADEKAINPPNLNVGGIGSLAWGAFLNNNVSLGIDLSGAFSSDPNEEGMFAVPIGIHTNYFFRAYPIEIPLHFGVGMNIMRYKDVTTFGFMMKAGTSIYWNAFQDWSFGLNFMYWWLPEIYSGDNGIPASHTRFGNFLEITISAMYNF